MRVRIIDYGMGNLRSIGKAVELYEANVKLIHYQDPQINALIKSADVIIIPGVGAFRDATANLKPISEDIVAFTNNGGFLLGICLGFQLFFTSSTEGGLHQGLNILQGEVDRFPSNLIVPHMGWNTLEILRNDDPLIIDIPNNSHVYFVHSYYAQPTDPNIIITETDYGGVKFASTVGKDTVYATQYHPEKSSAIGLKILQNFLELCKK